MAQTPDKTGAAKEAEQPVVVYFRCSAPAMGFMYKPENAAYPVRLAFENFLLKTSDKAVIAYLRENFVKVKAKGGVYTVKEITKAEYEGANPSPDAAGQPPAEEVTEVPPSEVPTVPVDELKPDSIPGKVEFVKK